MKNLYLLLLFPVLAYGQFESAESVSILQDQNDDRYLTGQTINVEAVIDGDAVIAGGEISIRDSIMQDLVMAGGEITVNGYVADDIRAAGGSLSINADVGDDVVMAGGSTHLAKNAKVHGNFISFSGTAELNGEVMGKVMASGGELFINGKVNNGMELTGGEINVNGEVYGPTKIIAEDIDLGENATFHGNVVYWSKDGEVDFKNTMANGRAVFDPSLAPDHTEISWRGLGIAAYGFWVFYVLSAFLVLLLLNWSFKNIFSDASQHLQKNWLKGLGNGLIYVFGLPLLIIVTFIMIIGIPVSLFLFAFYLFSVVFGHLVASLLLAHYLNNNGRNWNFWTLTSIALVFAVVLRLLTFIPFLGGLLSIALIAIGYGLLWIEIMGRRKSKLKLTS